MHVMRIVSLICLLQSALLALDILDAPKMPSITWFGDSREGYLDKPLHYRIGQSRFTISVHPGFVTDSASVPRIFWSLGLSPYEQYSRAAVVHDYLYWYQFCTREQSDNLMMIAMKESDVGAIRRRLVYWAVSVFGGGPWAANNRARENQTPRTVPESEWPSIDPNIHWPEFQKQLMAKGTKDKESTIDRELCRIGDSTEVPDH